MKAYIPHSTEELDDLLIKLVANTDPAEIGAFAVRILQLYTYGYLDGARHNVASFVLDTSLEHSVEDFVKLDTKTGLLTLVNAPAAGESITVDLGTVAMNEFAAERNRALCYMHNSILRKILGDMHATLREILTVLDSDHDYILAADMIRQLLGEPATKEGGDA